MKTIPFSRSLLFVFFLFPGSLLCALPVHSATTYSYDGRHRLTGAAYTDGGGIAYSYDATGNRLQETMSGPTALSWPSGSPPGQGPDTVYGLDSVFAYYAGGNGLLDDIFSFEQLPRGLTEVRAAAGLYEKGTP